MDERLDKAEELIESGLTDQAQNVLNEVKEDSARKYFVQSEVYRAMHWYTEQRKQLKKAVKAEPDNQKYKKALDDLNRVIKSDTFREMEKSDKMEKCCNALCEGGCSGLWGC